MTVITSPRRSKSSQSPLYNAKGNVRGGDMYSNKLADRGLRRPPKETSKRHMVDVVDSLVHGSVLVVSLPL